MSPVAPFANVPKYAKTQPTPYKVSVSEEKLSEFKQLLKLSRIGPETYETLNANPEEGKFGITRRWLIDAKKEWETNWQWAPVQDNLNSFPNYTMRVEDIDVQFLALFSEKPDAVPVIMLHGWPGSILEFIPILSLMQKQYSPAELPYHMIIPSLPGYGFSSGPPLDRDFTIADTARVLNTLMIELGFGESGYVVQGGDVGSRAARVMGAKYAECKAVHLNYCMMPKPDSVSLESLTTRESAGIDRIQNFTDMGSAYAREHASRPSTIGLVLGTNPLALLAWIGEKFLQWTDTSPPLSEILTAVSLYWFTDSFPRAIYPYRETYAPTPRHHGAPDLYIAKPLGYSCFPKEIAPVPASWVATTGNLCWTKIHDKGGHFAAFEEPAALKDDLESFIAQVWKGV